MTPIDPSRPKAIGSNPLPNPASESESLDSQTTVRLDSERILNQTAIGLIALDSKGTILYANPAAAKILGLSQEHVVGCCYYDFLDPIEVEQVRARHQGLMEGRLPAYTAKKRFRRRDGEVVETLTTAISAPVPELNSKILISQSIDLTMLKWVEYELYSSRTRFESFMRHAPVCGWIEDGRGRLSLVNPQLLKLLKLEKSLLSVDNDPDRAISIGQLPLNLADWCLEPLPPVVDRPIETLTPIQNALGDRRELLICRFPLNLPEHEDQGSPLVTESQNVGGVGIDLTDLRRAQAELEQARRTAEQANQAKTAFLAHFGHEIRTPLTAILGFTEVLHERLGHDPQSAEALEAIQSAGSHLKMLLNDFLDLSKIESGKLELTPTSIDPWELAVEVATINQGQAQAKGIRLGVEANASTPLLVHVDTTRLRQVLFNLVGNAIKFSQGGDVTISLIGSEPNASDSDTDGRSTLVWQVRDQGPGMTADQVARLFEPFHQVGTANPRDTLSSGSGLGLVISKSLVELMGGTIQVASHPGRGTTVQFELPIDPATPRRNHPSRWWAQVGSRTTPSESQSRSSASRTPSAPSAVGSRPRPVSISHHHAHEDAKTGHRLLIVEDNSDNRVILRFYLNRENPQLQLHFANDGAEALRYVLDQPAFDLILMDINMPTMDGYETTRRIRAAGYDGPIVALTAHALSNERERMRKAGFNEFLAKPFEVGELRRILAEFLSGPLKAKAVPSASGAVVAPATSRTALESSKGCYSVSAAERDVTFEAIESRFRAGLPKQLARLRGFLAVGDRDRALMNLEKVLAACRLYGQHRLADHLDDFRAQMTSDECDITSWVDRWDRLGLERVVVWDLAMGSASDGHPAT
jgi:PAS domain S-box-containing protein